MHKYAVNQLIGGFLVEIVGRFILFSKALSQQVVDKIRFIYSAIVRYL